MADIREVMSAPPTIYDVARVAGVSIASVSRVLNGRRNPREETRERVLQAVAELGFVPDGAARALSARLKEVVGVVIRRVRWVQTSEGGFAEEDESLIFTDVINRGIELPDVPGKPPPAYYLGARHPAIVHQSVKQRRTDAEIRSGGIPADQPGCERRR